MKKTILLILMFLMLSGQGIFAGKYTFTSLSVPSLRQQMECYHTRTTNSSVAIKVKLDSGTKTREVKFRTLNFHDESPLCDWVVATEGGSEVKSYYNNYSGYAGDEIYVVWRSNNWNAAKYTVKGYYDYQ